MFSRFSHLNRFSVQRNWFRYTRLYRKWFQVRRWTTPYTRNRMLSGTAQTFCKEKEKKQNQSSHQYQFIKKSCNQIRMITIRGQWIIYVCTLSEAGTRYLTYICVCVCIGMYLLSLKEEIVKWVDVNINSSRCGW